MKIRDVGRAAAALVGIVALAATATESHHTTRHDLVGAWHLVRIDVQGTNGSQVDPFYGSASEGLLIYDRDGWFSVQIMSAPRPALEVPAIRPQAPGGRDAAAKEGVVDSYYAYYGTWTFDRATSTVTHHATGALYPSESRASYSQQVHVEGDRMTFTRTSGTAEHRTIQTKTWDRVRTAPGHGKP
jgi:hypothetical protein